MAALILLVTFSLVIATLQILLPDMFVKLRVWGARNRESVRTGGYITFVVIIIIVLVYTLT